MSIDIPNKRWQAIAKNALNYLNKGNLDMIETKIPRMLTGVNLDKNGEYVYEITTNVLQSYIITNIKPKLLTSDKILYDFDRFWAFYQDAFSSLVIAFSCPKNFIPDGRFELQELNQEIRSRFTKYVLQNDIINRKLLDALHLVTENVKNGNSSELAIVESCFSGILAISPPSQRNLQLAILDRSTAYYRSLDDSVFEHIDDIVVFAEQLEAQRHTETELFDRLSCITWKENIDRILLETIVTPNIPRFFEPLMDDVRILMDAGHFEALDLICKSHAFTSLLNNTGVLTSLIQSILSILKTNAPENASKIKYIFSTLVKLFSIANRSFNSIDLTGLSTIFEKEIPLCDKIPKAFASYLNGFIASYEKLDSIGDFLLLTKFFVEDQKVLYEKELKKLLAKRLLGNPNNKKERSLLEILESKPQGTINNSKTIKYYKNKIYYEGLSNLVMDVDESVAFMKNQAHAVKGLACNILFLRPGEWGIVPSPRCRLPVFLENIFEKYKREYLAKYQGRKLELETSFGSAVLKGNFYKNGETSTKYLTVATYQLSVLMQFNEADELTFEELQEKTEIQEDRLKKILASLSSKNKKILARRSHGKAKVKYSVNDDFTSNESSIFLC